MLVTADWQRKLSEEAKRTAQTRNPCARKGAMDDFT